MGTHKKLIKAGHLKIVRAKMKLICIDSIPQKEELTKYHGSL